MTRVSAPAGLCWYACHTRARAEKQVARQLSVRGLENYLPLLAQRRQWKDRRKVVSLPLFPGYVFGRFSLQETHTVLSIPGVSTIVSNNGRLSPIAEAELCNVRRLSAVLSSTGLEAERHPLVIEAGQPVRVADGPFQGVEGWVIESRGQQRLLVGLRAIGQGLEIDIARRHLEPLPTVLERDG